MQALNQVSTINKRIKLNFKENLKIKTKNLTFKNLDTSPEGSPAKQRLRKSSFNLKLFNHIDLRKQMSIQQTFQDYYELQKKIGQGGHSVVYKCKSLTDGKIYAVKITRKNDPQNLQNLKQQYRILAGLKHQGILKGHFLFLNEKKSICHLVCQYYGFPNLREILVENKNQPICEKKIGQIVKKILQAIRYLHERKVSHRDLKPQNILYDQKTGNIKIIDFEVAKMTRYTHQKLQMWTKAGTATYRSPQLLKGSYNQLTDMWSLGVITYQLLTGKLPFTAHYQHNMYEQILNFIPDLSKLDISGVGKSFLSKLLQKDPKQRMTAKQALSHPFILTVSTPISLQSKKLNSSFDNKDDQEFTKSTIQNQESPRNKFYDENDKFCFLSSINKDIGIRFCEQ